MNDSKLFTAWTIELDAARRTRAKHDAASEWKRLERAHIVSPPTPDDPQPMLDDAEVAA